MCSIKEDNVQTYPIRKSEKPKLYAFSIVVWRFPTLWETLSNNILKKTANPDNKTNANTELGIKYFQIGEPK